MRAFFKKLCVVFLLLLVFPGSVIVLNAYVDTFNVFHWKKIRFTSAEPNKNFIKTKYVLENPDRFNAFVFGSSRAGMLPVDTLPAELNGSELRWYNMSYSEGIPSEHVETLRTFLNHGVDVKIVVVAFDCMMMYLDEEAHRKQLMRMSYGQYEKSPLGFYKKYLLSLPDKSIVSQIMRYEPQLHEDSVDVFYKYGVNSVDMGLSSDCDPERYKPVNFDYTMKDSWKGICDLYDLCAANHTQILFITNPVYESNYRYAAAHGYFDMLQKIGERCKFYNFSCLNKISTDMKYYFEASHYRPIVGLTVEKILFSDDEDEKRRIREQVALNDGDCELFGMKVDSSNVSDVIEKLKNQLRNN
ncbi:MAG: hypothetical protein II921_09155 [Treponema sp.]|nr:hypothetical protein [Treponema sp.]